MRHATRIIPLLLFAGLLPACSTPAAAPALDEFDEDIIFAIGEPDGNCGEFALAGGHEEFQTKFGAGPLAFNAERDDPALHWPFIHPGSCDAWAGGLPHEITIRFPLRDAPQGMFKLVIGFSDTHNWFPPNFRVRIGGRSVDVPLAGGAGPASLKDPAKGKHQKLELIIPNCLLARGENEVALSCRYGAWVAYDYLVLLHYPDFVAPPPVITELSVEPTPFRLRKPGAYNGEVQLSRELRAVVAAKNAQDIRLHVDVKAAGGSISYEAPVTALPYNGRLVQGIAAPDLDSPMDVTVTASAGDSFRSVSMRVNPMREWRIFVAPSSHTDIGYTALQPVCAEIHCQNIDDAIASIKAYPDFKWNAEVAWQVEEYLASRPEAKIENFLAMAREGKIGVQALHNNILTGLVSHEQACRLTAFAHELHCDRGIPYESAMIVDIPTVEAFMPMILALAGIRYFSTASNLHRSEPFRELFAKSPCWWDGPDGSRVLTMFLEGYAHAARMARGLDSARAEMQSLIARHENRPDYPCDAIYVQGLMYDNGTINTAMAEVGADWNELYESPKLVFCRNAEFFQYVEQCCGDELPAVKGSGGSYWEDGAASTAFEQAKLREARERLANADKFLALASCVSPKIEYPSGQLKQTWRLLMLADEHTWGAGSSVSSPESEFVKAQWDIKRGYMEGAWTGADNLWQQAVQAVAALAKTEADSLLVVNPMSWTRTDVVKCRLPQSCVPTDTGSAHVRVGDETWILARDVPSCGYKTLALQNNRTSPEPIKIQGAVIESGFYKLVFDPDTGALMSLVDKESGRELKDSGSEFGINEYLYVSGNAHAGIRSRDKNAMPELKTARIENASLQAFDLGALGQMMVVEGNAAMTPNIRSEIIAWNHDKRVDFNNRFSKTLTYDKEAVYFAFPFKAESAPEFNYEIANGIVCANTDMLPGACLEWFAVQHFVEILSPGLAVAWATPDAPLVCFNDIHRGVWRRKAERRFDNGHVFAYVMNNYWDTNYKAGQDGDFSFDFSVSSGGHSDRTAVARFGWNASNPMSAVVAGANFGGVLDGSAGSLVAIDSPNVILVGGKQAEDGNGLVLRLWEMQGVETECQMRLGIEGSTCVSAEICDLMETPEHKLSVDKGQVIVPVLGHGLSTLRINQSVTH